MSDPLSEYERSLTVDERYRMLDRLFRLEKAILAKLAPESFSDTDVLEFTYYHMYGEKWPDDWKHDKFFQNKC